VLGLIETIGTWDNAAMAFGEGLRWEPLTAFMVVASAWWVKWPLFALVGALGDCRCPKRRRLFPAAIAAGLAAATAGILVTLVKVSVDRARPPVADPGLDPVGAVPASASFPSGHSATAFATAVAVGLVYPRLRLPLLALAALVALSRVYLGMHYSTDVLAGTALGIAVGLATGWAVLRAARSPRSPWRSHAPA
jgi:membrane-associated phospholipid phosphatase